MSQQQMSGADAAWLHMDRPTNPMVVNSVLWFDEPVDGQALELVLRERLVEPFPRFSQRAIEPRSGVGLPHWVDDDEFELDRHLHRIALPSPGDRAALQDLVGDLISAPLDRSRPLWDMYLIDRADGRSALVSRFHHAIADGIALARVMLSMADGSPEASIAHERRPNALPQPAESLARAVAGGLHLLSGAVQEGIDVLVHPRAEIADLVAAGAQDTRAAAKLLLTPPDRGEVFRGELGPRQKVCWSDGCSLEEIQAVGRATHTTVNDVVVSAVSGALRRYVLDRGGHPDELRAMVPFNLRPLDQPLPRELGNRFGLVYLNLPLGLRGRRQRLEAVHDRMESIKHSPEGAVAYGLLGLVGLTPPQIEQRVVGMFTSKCSLVLTNVRGPQEPVSLAGARVAGVIPWVPAAGSIGMGVSIFSYGGRVLVGLRVDAALVPDPERIITEVERELSELVRLRAA
jgi:WS/DGAT/MGAT family acyltransferase